MTKNSDANQRQRVLERFRVGVNTILASDQLHQTNFTSYEIEDYADSLLNYVSDYFDRMIIATARVYEATLLTEDKVLINIAKKHERYRDLKTITWAEI